MSINFAEIIEATLNGDGPNTGDQSLDNAALSITTMAKAFGHTADDMTESLTQWAKKNGKA